MDNNKIKKKSAKQTNVLVIPSLNPKKEFVFWLKEFKEKIKSENIEVDIIVVNDGSSEKYNEIFDEIIKEDITVLKHYINLGKGRALKTAFNHILNTEKKLGTIITADSDGQHSIKDVLACLKISNENPDTLILGTRKFGNTNSKIESGKSQIRIPFRSKFGNKLTSIIFKYLLGIDVSDAQTGLRAFGKKQAKDYLKTKGEKFEYETNMLIDNKNLGYKFKENKIETIYIEDNKLSHFNPINDSIAIYSLFLKYIIIAIFSFLVDILLFKISLNLKNTILISTIIARIVSSILNYKLNRNKVFKSFNKTSLFKYYILVVVQMFISGASVSALNKVFEDRNVIFLKILVDIIVFMVNYYIQREWVFKKEKK